MYWGEEVISFEGTGNLTDKQIEEIIELGNFGALLREQLKTNKLLEQIILLLKPKVIIPEGTPLDSIKWLNSPTNPKGEK